MTSAVEAELADMLARAKTRIGAWVTFHEHKWVSFGKR